MTSTEQDTGSDPIVAAIAALTTAARKTRTRGAGASSETVEPVDFGEIACHVLTTVAANVGGVDQLLAGRPGSWEADYVRQIVQSTAGDEDPLLLRWRTEPIRLTFYVDVTYSDFGLEDLYEEAQSELGRAEEEADSAVFAAFSTAEERARLDEIHAAIDAGPKWGSEGWERDRERILALYEEAGALVQGIHERADAAGHPASIALDAALHARETVDLLWEQDQAAYHAAYAETVRRALSERGANVDVELVDEYQDWDDLADQLHEIARALTPLPMTGHAPDWSEGTPADALRRAGLTYTARARAAAE